MKQLGFIGYGNFGRFIMPYLRPYFDITIYDAHDYSAEVTAAGFRWDSLKVVAAKEIVVAGIPVQFLESLLLEIKDYVVPGSLFIDISSVKVKPVELMLRHLPSKVEILGTHPLFGPQSGKGGIKELNLVLCPVTGKRTNNIIRFFSQVLQLNVLERTPMVHDQQMSYVQALTHFIGRAINEMDIPDVEQKTPAYQYLLNIKRNLGMDSMDLFLTIEKENPYAKAVRDQFIEELIKLNKKLQ
jgi:prephenate dehydrogenase